MRERRVTHRFQAITISGTSLIMYIVYLLFSPNWIGIGFVRTLETIMLW